MAARQKKHPLKIAFLIIGNKGIRSIEESFLYISTPGPVHLVIAQDAEPHNADLLPVDQKGLSSNRFNIC